VATAPASLNDIYIKSYWLLSSRSIRGWSRGVS